MHTYNHCSLINLRSIFLSQHVVALFISSETLQLFLSDTEHEKQLNMSTEP